MTRKLAVFAVLSCAIAFGQSRPMGAGSPNTGTPSSPPGGPDTGPQSELRMKSIDQVLHDDPSLAAKLKEMLPADVTPQQACSGFKSVEQCVTTIHVAQNLKVPFADLKEKTTGKGSTNLQKAVEQMASSANAKDEVKKAKKQASEDMKGVSLFGA